MSAVAIAVKYLLSQSTVTAIAGTRIYPEHLPQTAAPPAVLVRLSADSEMRDVSGVHAPTMSSVVIETLATTATGASDLAETIKLALRDKWGVTVTLSAGPHAGARKAWFFKAGADTSDYASDRSIYRRIMTYDLTWS